MSSRAHDYDIVSNPTDGGHKLRAQERASLRVLSGNKLWRSTVYATQGDWQLFLTIPPAGGKFEGVGSQTRGRRQSLRLRRDVRAHVAALARRAHGWGPRGASTNRTMRTGSPPIARATRCRRSFHAHQPGRPLLCTVGIECHRSVARRPRRAIRRARHAVDAATARIDAGLARRASRRSSALS